jgi:hypothetical protein
MPARILMPAALKPSWRPCGGILGDHVIEISID